MEQEEKKLMAEEYLQQGQVLLGSGAYEKAIEYLDKVILIDKFNYAAYVSKAIAEINLDQTDCAEECIDRAIMIDKSNPDAYVHKGNMELLKDRTDEAIKNYNQAISLGYGGAEVYYSLGLVYENQRNPELALRNYTKAIHLDELNPVYRVRKASIQILTEKYKEALQTLEELRKMCPESFEGYHLTAAVYTMMEQYEKADEVLAFAEKLFPEDREILYDRIRVLVTKGDLDLAVEKLTDLEQRCQDVNEQKEILLNKAKIYGQQDKSEEAEKALLTALQSGTDEEKDLEIQYLLMNFSLLSNNYEKVYEWAMKLDQGKNTNLYALGGKYYMALAMKQKAEKEYETYYQDAIRYYRGLSLENPSRIEAYLFRAMCLKDLGQYEKALEMVDYVIVLQPNTGQLHQIKGNIYKEMKNHEAEAQKEYQMAEAMGVKSVFPMEV